MNNKKQYFYFGHHKCATTYVRFILDDVSEHLNLKHHTFDNPKQFEGNLNQYLISNPADFVSYTNAKYSYISPLIETLNIRGFHIIRDPRDIAVSGYFSHLNSHPLKEWSELEQKREKLKRLTFEEGLTQEINELDWLVKDLEKWNYNTEGILELKFEQLIENPYKTFLEVFHHLRLIDNSVSANLKSIKFTGKLFLNSLLTRLFDKSLKNKIISEIELLNIVHNRDFKRLTGKRSRGVEDKNHHFRKGISGDWANHFTEYHKTLFKEKYNSALVKLGYEKDSDW